MKLVDVMGVFQNSKIVTKNKVGEIKSKNEKLKVRSFSIILKELMTQSSFYHDFS